jgi:hypothetical protein
VKDGFGAGAALAAAGAWRLRRRDPVLLAGLAVQFLLGVPFLLWLSNSPPDPFYSLVLVRLIGCGLIAVVLCAAAGFSRIREAARGVPYGGALVCALAVGLPIAMAAAHYETCDRDDSNYTESLGRAIFSSVEPGAIVFNCYDTVHYALHELRDVRGVRPDVILVGFAANPGEARRARESLPDWGLPSVGGMEFSRALMRASRGRRPIYFTFAGRCNGEDYLGGELRSQLLPAGLVYRWSARPDPELALRSAQMGMRILLMQPQITEDSMQRQTDPARREILSWYVDAYANLAIAWTRLGRDAEARYCLRQAKEVIF